MQLSQFGDQQDRLQLDPDHGETLNAFLFGDNLNLGVTP